MDDVNLANDLKRMLDQFRQAAARIAEGADFARVLEPFRELAIDQQKLRESRAGSADLASASVASIFLSIGTSADTVTVLQMYFKEGITLGAIEAELGEWQRDPPEPEEAAYTSAYFNAERIAPGASFQVSALIEEWCDCFTPQTLVDSLNIGYREARAAADQAR